MLTQPVLRAVSKGSCFPPSVFPLWMVIPSESITLLSNVFLSLMNSLKPWESLTSKNGRGSQQKSRYRARKDRVRSADLSWDMLSCSFPVFSLTPPAPHTAEPGHLSSLVIPSWSNSSGALVCEFVLTNTNMWIYNELGPTASQSQPALISPKAQRCYKGDLFVCLFLELYFKLGKPLIFN